MGRALTALLCDTGVSCRWSNQLELTSLLSTSAHALVVFGAGFGLLELTQVALTIHAQRPDLALVVVATQAAVRNLSSAFEGAWAAPPILRDTAPASVIRDALAIAYEACEGAHKTSSSGTSFDARVAAAAPIRARLAAKEPVSDARFDQFLPKRMRDASFQYWTPLDVIQRAAGWFEDFGIQRVVDVGSGVGKFCVAGALGSRCYFVGIEQRPALATVARELSRVFGVEDRVDIIDGVFGDIDVPPADCYYFYNPFEENLLPTHEVLDANVELNADRFRRDVRAFRSLARSAPLGTYVLTYNGVGGRMPDCLEQVCVDRELPTVLRMLQKVRW